MVIGKEDIVGLSNSAIIPIFRSPELTKIGFGYTPMNSAGITSRVKSIDYLNNIVTELTFQNLPHYIQTMQYMNSYDF